MSEDVVAIAHVLCVCLLTVKEPFVKQIVYRRITLFRKLYTQSLADLIPIFIP